MDTNRNQDDRRENFSGNQKQDGSEETFTGSENETEPDVNSPSGIDERHHQQHGNRKYESHKNHSSADDQPTTDTGPGI